MIYVVAALTILFGISFAVYRTAKTEALGFKALAAWVVFAALDVVALIAWAILALARNGTTKFP